MFIEQEFQGLRPRQYQLHPSQDALAAQREQHHLLVIALQDDFSPMTWIAEYEGEVLMRHGVQGKVDHNRENDVRLPPRFRVKLPWRALKRPERLDIIRNTRLSMGNAQF